MRVTPIVALAAALVLVSAAAGEDVLEMNLQYKHPLDGEGAGGTFACGSWIDMAEDYIQVEVVCDPSGPGNCYTMHIYEIVSGSDVQTAHSNSGSWPFIWVETDVDDPVLKGRICDDAGCDVEAGPYCEMDNHVWDMPDQRCEFLLSRIYERCLIYIDGPDGEPWNYPTALADCQANYDARWECLADCFVNNKECWEDSLCVTQCFPPIADDDTADDDTVDDDAADDDATDDDADDDDADDDDVDDDSGDDDRSTGGDEGTTKACACDMVA